jgi:hypothetical protein
VSIVPGNLACAATVLPVITRFAPSRAQRNAISRPMPRLEPVTNIVLPRKSFIAKLPSEIQPQS